MLEVVCQFRTHGVRHDSSTISDPLNKKYGKVLRISHERGECRPYYVIPVLNGNC